MIMVIMQPATHLPVHILNFLTMFFQKIILIIRDLLTNRPLYIPADTHYEDNQ